MRTELKFLLSGPGLMGRQHAALLLARPDCRLAAIVAPDHASNTAFAREHGAAFFTDMQTALDQDDFDAVIISSPNEFHFAQAVACMRRGLPVFVEKPVTSRIDDALALAELAEELKVPVLVGHHRTYNPLLASLEDFIRSPRFGRPVAVQGSALFYKPRTYFEEGPWRQKIGGGPILINLIHEIGIMRTLYGNIRSVFAFASNAVRHFEVEDTVAINFSFENGALGTFLLSDTAASSKSWEMTTGENPVYPHFPAENCYHFAGTNGSLDFPSMHARCYPREDAASWWKPFETLDIPIARASPLERQLDHFVAVVRGRATPRVTARDGYLNMRVVDAIKSSIDSGSVIDLAGAAPEPVNRRAAGGSN